MINNIFKYLRERHALGSVVYYIIVIPTVIIFMAMPQFNDGGPCNPGTNLAVLLLAIVLTVILFCVYTVILLIKGRPYQLPFLIHMGVVIAIALMIFIGAMIYR